MNLYELPVNIVESLLRERESLYSNWYVNNAYEVCFTDVRGTRYFYAKRNCIAYGDDKGNYMPFGGGSEWRVSYGVINWRRTKQPIGNDYDYSWVKSSKTFGKSANGTEIPLKVARKKDVIALAKKIGNLIIDKE